MRLYWLALLLLLGVPAYSAEIGGGIAVKRACTPYLAADVYFPQTQHLDLYAGLTLVGPYEAQGQEYKAQAFARLGARYHHGQWAFSLGYAAIQHDDWINSGRINFHLGISRRLGSWVLKYDHVSNGGSSAPNKGRDMLGVAKEIL